LIHVYGLVQGLAELPPLSGVCGAALELRRIAGLELVVSRSAPERSEVTEQELLAHASVVEELTARSRAILPARFGPAFASERELEAAVRTKAPALEHGLTRVRGCVEFGLRVLDAESRREAPAALSGGEYMRARLAAATGRDRLSEELHRPLARLSRATVRVANSRDLLHAAYLVPRENVRAFGEHVSNLEVAHSKLTMICTGPWPPYTFADEHEETYERPA
jgi:hypothetical protein